MRSCNALVEVKKRVRKKMIAHRIEEKQIVNEVGFMRWQKGSVDSKS